MLHYVASDGCALILREAIDAMDEEIFRLYLDYHYNIFCHSFLCRKREDLFFVG